MSTIKPKHLVNVAETEPNSRTLYFKIKKGKICIFVCSFSPVFFTGYWVGLKGHLSTSCKYTHKTGIIKGKSMCNFNYLLLSIVKNVCTKAFWNIFVLLTWETAKWNFVCVLNLVTVRVYIYSCIWWMHFKYILNKSKIESGERICWKSLIKYE